MQLSGVGDTTRDIARCVGKTRCMCKHVGQHKGPDIKSKEGRQNEWDVFLGVAHGTRDPAGIHSVLQILDAVRTRCPDLDIRLAYIELVDPAVPAALGDIPAGSAAVVVPLLLSSGYHDRVDLPAAIRAARPGTAHAAVLGPDPLLAVALADRLEEAGWRPGDAVVLAGAGSSDPDAVRSVHDQAALLGAELLGRTDSRTARVRPGSTGAGVRTPAADAGARPAGNGVAVTVGFGSAAQPAVAAAVAAARAAGAQRVAIAPYLLAPGFFADRLADAGADLVAAPLGAHPAVVDLLLFRAGSTQG